MNTEAQVLADVFDATRAASLQAFNAMLKAGVDLHQSFSVEGKNLNAPFWIMAHLAVSEQFLLLHALGGPRIKLPYARMFGLGAIPPTKENCPPLDEIMRDVHLVHEASMQWVRGLSQEDLLAPTATGTSFGGVDQKRALIIHAIRHEGMHAGHLGWLCKIHGLPTL
jgi:hypothetical protein